MISFSDADDEDDQSRTNHNKQLMLRELIEVILVYINADRFKSKLFFSFKSIFLSNKIILSEFRSLTITEGYQKEFDPCDFSQTRNNYSD